ncbi:MAG: hypothetical protein QXO35_02745 [Candidatus Micrarchaeia archaeon]
MAFSKQQVGYFAFIAGLFVAAFVAVAYPALMPIHVYSLGLLGIIIGLLNIEAREVWPYILAAVAFLVASTTFMQTIDALPVVNLLLERFLNALIYIVGPGVFVVSLRIIYEAAKSRESLPHPLKEEKTVTKKAEKKRKR